MYKLILFLEYTVGKQMLGACKVLDACQIYLKFFPMSNYSFAHLNNIAED